MKAGHGNFIEPLDRILNRVARWASMLAAPAGVVLIAWPFLFGAFIGSRTLFNINWVFVEEFTTYWLVMVVFFSLAYGLRKGVHIQIKLVLELLPKRARSIMAAITSSLALVFVCILIWRTAGYVEHGLAENIHSMTESYVLLWPAFLLVPIGFAALGLTLLLQVFRDIIQVVRSGRQN